jgi:hypothetical protein
MTLADSSRAIGAVTKLLHDRLMASNGAAISDVTVGRPEPGPGTPDNVARLNLFLYEVRPDGHLRNESLDEGQAPPIWIALSYLLTAFDRSGESDSIDAHELLGLGMRALNDLNFPSFGGLPAASAAALADMPEKLKVTFDDASLDLLSKVMQGSDEHYRCSAAFQVRPVMIASQTPPSYALQVGVDYQDDTVIGEDGVAIEVLAGIGPVLEDVTPAVADLGGIFTLTGSSLDYAGVSVKFGPVELPITSQRPDRLTCRLDPARLTGDAISAGSQAITIVRNLPNGRQRSSNPLIASLRPRLDTATPSGVALADAGDPSKGVVATVDLAGALLGTATDDVFAALYRDGSVVRVVDSFTVPAGPAQSALRFTLTVNTAVPAGTYRLVLRVNGQQARTSPELELVAP